MRDLELVTIHSVNPANGKIYVTTDTNPSPVPAVLTSSSPIDLEGGGEQAYPTPIVGIKAIAWKNDGVYYILSYTYIRNIFGFHEPMTTRNTLSSGDRSIRTSGGNFIKLETSGIIQMFSDLWSNIILNKSLGMLKMTFKQVKMYFMTGIFEVAYNEENDNGSITIVGGRTYEPIESTDINNAPEDYKSPNYLSHLQNPASVVSDTSSSYTDKGFLRLGNHDDGQHLLSLETRQFTGTSALSTVGRLVKDVVTYDRRGYQEDNDTLREFVIIDRVRGLIDKNIVTSDEYSRSIEYYTPVIRTKEDDSIPRDATYISTVNRSGYSISYDTLTATVTTSSEEDIKEIITNKLVNKDVFTRQIDIDGKITQNARLVEHNYDMTAGDICKITLPNAEITIDYDGNMIIDKVTSIQLGGATEELENAVLTPNKVFENGFLKDPFTGLPYFGSRIVKSL